MRWQKAHFIGLGGVGMSATAKLLKDQGVVVTGSDEEVYPPISTFLEQAGLAYKTPYKPENIPSDTDVIVIGKNAKLVPENNTEVAAAVASGKPILSFPEVLAELSKDKENIVVAGAYGKSTSTALLAHCLQVAGKDSSYFVGAIPVDMPNAAMGAGRLFVLEGDEYPSSNTDPRSKFLLMHPTHVLVTPLAHDHFNIFPTPQDYLKPFVDLVTLMPNEGTLVVCTEGPLSHQFLSHISRPVVTYGLHEGDYAAANIVWGEHTSFDVMHQGSPIVSLTTTQLGEHNVQNMVGVAALLLANEFVTTAQLQEAVASFKGVVRRLDKKSEKTTIPIYEGFGSSYEKAKSAIAAMKLHYPQKRLVVVFEPYTINWRRRETLTQYEDVFMGASQVLIVEPPLHGKGMEVPVAEMAEHARVSVTEVFGCTSAEGCLANLSLQPDDAVLLLTSGNLGGLIESIPKLAEQKFPK